MHVGETKKRACDDPQDRRRRNIVEAMAVPVNNESENRTKNDRQYLLRGSQVSSHVFLVPLHEDDIC